MHSLAAIFTILGAADLLLGLAAPLTLTTALANATTTTIGDLNQSNVTLTVTTLLHTAISEYKLMMSSAPASTWEAASAQNQTSTASGSVDDETVGTIVGVLILFGVAVIALTCLGYGSLREGWWTRIRNKFRGGAAAHADES